MVTGATGTVGSQVVKELQKTPVSIRIGSRKNPSLPNTGWVALDFTRPETFIEALKEVNRIFLMRPPALSDINLFLPFIEKARESGVNQIVFLSLSGAEKVSFLPHRKIEVAIERLTVPYIFLRAGFFMQNLITTHREEICSESRIVVPSGKGKTAFIDTRDIAAVAAKLLTSPVGKSSSITLTGAHAISYGKVAGILSQVLGREIRYKSSSLPEFIFRNFKKGIPWAMNLVMTVIFTTTRFGAAEKITEDVEKILGRQPISFEQFAKDHVKLWLTPSGKLCEPKQ